MHVILYFQACGWWQKNKEKIWCRKQTQTLFYSSILVPLFSVWHISVFTSCVHAVSSVITNNAIISLIIIVQLQYNVVYCIISRCAYSSAWLDCNIAHKLQPILETRLNPFKPIFWKFDFELEILSGGL